MAIRDWSVRRLAAVWALGLLAWFAMVAVPYASAVWFAQFRGPALLQDFAGQKAREDTSKRADSISIAEQRSRAIRDGQYSVTAQGDTVVATVSMTDPRSIILDTATAPATLVEQLSDRTYRRIFVRLALIPLLLLGITAVWSWWKIRQSGPQLAR